MKKRVELSSYCIIISAIMIAVMCGVVVYAAKQPDNEVAVWILSAAFLALILSTLVFMPISVSVDKNFIKVARPLKTKKIPLKEVSDVRLCSPTMGAIRMCGSGGCFGWYGWFKEKDLGKYFAYYGKASDCFLITLKDGRKYMLGCKDAHEMVEFLDEEIN